MRHVGGAQFLPGRCVCSIVCMPASLGLSPHDHAVG